MSVAKIKEKADKLYRDAIQGDTLDPRRGFVELHSFINKIAGGEAPAEEAPAEEAPAPKKRRSTFKGGSND